MSLESLPSKSLLSAVVDGRLSLSALPAQPNLLTQLGMSTLTAEFFCSCKDEVLRALAEVGLNPRHDEDWLIVQERYRSHYEGIRDVLLGSAREAERIAAAVDQARRHNDLAATDHLATKDIRLLADIWQAALVQIRSLHDACLQDLLVETEDDDWEGTPGLVRHIDGVAQRLQALFTALSWNWSQAAMPETWDLRSLSAAVAPRSFSPSPQSDEDPVYINRAAAESLLLQALALVVRNGVDLHHRTLDNYCNLKDVWSSSSDTADQLHGVIEKLLRWDKNGEIAVTGGGRLSISLPLVPETQAFFSEYEGRLRRELRLLQRVAAKWGVYLEADFERSPSAQIVLRMFFPTAAKGAELVSPDRGDTFAADPAGVSTNLVEQFCFKRHLKEGVSSPSEYLVSLPAAGIRDPSSRELLGALLGRIDVFMSQNRGFDTVQIEEKEGAVCRSLGLSSSETLALVFSGELRPGAAAVGLRDYENLWTPFYWEEEGALYPGRTSLGLRSLELPVERSSVTLSSNLLLYDDQGVTLLRRILSLAQPLEFELNHRQVDQAGADVFAHNLTLTFMRELEKALRQLKRRFPGEELFFAVEQLDGERPKQAAYKYGLWFCRATGERLAVGLFNSQNGRLELERSNAKTAQLFVRRCVQTLVDLPEEHRENFHWIERSLRRRGIDASRCAAMVDCLRERSAAEPEEQEDYIKHLAQLVVEFLDDPMVRIREHKAAANKRLKVLSIFDLRE